MASAMEAASLSNLQTFIRLADFLSRLLMLCPSCLFEPWSMTFTSTCIQYSRKYPNLSSFYRLITSALQCLNGLHMSGEAAMVLSLAMMRMHTGRAISVSNLL